MIIIYIHAIVIQELAIAVANGHDCYQQQGCCVGSQFSTT